MLVESLCVSSQVVSVMSNLSFAEIPIAKALELFIRFMLSDENGSRHTTNEKCYESVAKTVQEEEANSRKQKSEKKKNAKKKKPRDFSARCFVENETMKSNESIVRSKCLNHVRSTCESSFSSPEPGTSTSVGTLFVYSFTRLLPLLRENKKLCENIITAPYNTCTYLKQTEKTKKEWKKMKETTHCYEYTSFSGGVVFPNRVFPSFASRSVNSLFFFRILRVARKKKQTKRWNLRLHDSAGQSCRRIGHVEVLLFIECHIINLFRIKTFCGKLE